MIEVARVGCGGGLYEAACALRERDLLNPVGLDLARYRAAMPGVEEASEHFVALEHGEVIGCVLLRAEGDRGVLAQMVVDRDRQGSGVGRMLVEALLARAFGELGLAEVRCHAREEAQAFYERLGWTFDSEVFEEVGIPHRVMRIGREGWSGA